MFKTIPFIGGIVVVLIIVIVLIFDNANRVLPKTGYRLT
jgi:hypothetical protein